MSVELLSKFKGALVGAVVADCIGSIFEGLWAPGIKMERVTKSILKVEKEGKKATEEETEKTNCKIWEYTDDTAMARSVAASLIQNNGLNAEDLAKRFTESFFQEPHRGYGMGVTCVFQKLQECNYLDPFRAASEQFEGTGSYGNGGAMRIVPAPLFAYKDKDMDKLAELVETITLITHSHRLAIDGAILQSYAVTLALQQKGEVCIEKFVNDLSVLMKPVEARSREILLRKKKKILQQEKKLEKNESDGDQTSKQDELDSPYPYCEILEKVKEFALRSEQPSSAEISKELGTDVSAYRSVPAAVYSFLRATKEVENIQDRNAFERTVMLAISLGGDTDTIATMAAAIAGAYYGIEAVPKYWQKSCESTDDALDYAEKLHKLQYDGK